MNFAPRSIAAPLLVALSVAAQQSVDDAISNLGSKSPRDRRQAVATLMSLGASAVPRLTTLLANSRFLERSAFQTEAFREDRGFFRQDPTRQHRLHGSVKTSHTDWFRVRKEKGQWPGVATRIEDVRRIRSNTQLAMFVLGTLGANASPAIPELARHLDAARDELCSQAAWTLARIGEKAVPTMIEHADFLDVPRALADIPELARPALIARIRAATTSDRVRARCISRLGFLLPPNDEQIALLIRTLSAKSRIVAARAIDSLGACGEAARTPLEAAFASESSVVRLRALAALLQNLPGPSSARTAIAGLADPDVRVARYAAEVVGMQPLHGSQPIVRDIRKAYEATWPDADVQMRRAILFGLAALRDELAATPEFVFESFADGQAPLRIAALRCLRQSDAPEFVALLKKWSTEPLPRDDRFESFDVFDRMLLRDEIASTAAAHLVATWRQLRDPHLQHDCLIALARLGPQAKSALQILLAALHHPDTRVCGAAARALAGLSDEAAPAKARLLELLSDRHARVGATKALYAIGAYAEIVQPSLQRLAKGKPSYDLETAIAALAALPPERDDTGAYLDALMRTWGKHKDTTAIQTAVIAALGSFELGWDQVIAFLASPDIDARVAAIGTVARVGIRPTRSLPSIERIAREDLDSLVRQTAKRSLPRLRRLAEAERDQLRVARVFSDHMVLQRDMPIRIWGTAARGTEVTVELNGKLARTIARNDRTWIAELPPMAADQKPHALRIRGGGTISLKDVLLGDVWFVSGQSNMSRPANGEQIESANAPMLRLFNSSGSTPRRDALDWPSGWTVCTPRGLRAAGDRWPDRKTGEVKVRAFSEVGYVFGRTLQAELGVPVGLIQASAGGSTARDWTPQEGIVSRFPFDHAVSRLKHTPGLLYHVRVRPLTRFSVRGTIWYQGEDDGRNLRYDEDLAQLISSWREAFRRDDMPFYMAQIGATSYASGMLAVYEAQQRIMNEVAHTGIAFSNDIYARHLTRLEASASQITDARKLERQRKHMQGLRKRLFRIGSKTGWPLHGMSNPHPPNKELIGTRLANIALREHYGLGNAPVFGPMFASCRVEDGKVIVTFKYVGRGLRSLDGKPLNWFELSDGSQARANGPYTYVKAEAEIIGKNRVALRARGMDDPRFARFGWHMYARFNLVGSSGLPAFPFRTDDARDPRKR